MNDEERVRINDDLDALLDHFHFCFGVRILFFSPMGRILRVGLKSPDSAFCRAVRGPLESEGCCLAQDKKMRAQATDNAEMLPYTCHAGLRECVYPIFNKGHLLGFAMIGQYRQEDEPSAKIVQAWLERRGDDAALRDDFRKLPRFAGEAEIHMIGLFKVIADYALAKGLVSMEGNLLVDKVIAWVDERVSRPHLPLAEVAAQVRKSPSTVSHIVKRETGMSFRRLVVEKKLDAAEAMFASAPDSPVSEIAEALGFHDQFFFSKLFKKYRGVSPREYVKKYRF